ncbi:MAG: hypothetical protein ABEJ88_02570 [Halobacterium sp.]
MSGDALVEELREETGEALRVVAEYDRDGYHVRYVRDDVDPKLKRVGDDIYRDLILEGISREHLEDLFEAGDLHCTMHRFDELTAFHFAEEEYSGLFVGVDSSADVPLATFADTCWKRL